MCVVKISDSVMKQAGLRDEHEALVEFACRLFDANKLSFDGAMEMTGLSEEEVVKALVDRKIRINYYTADDAQKELAAFERAGS